MTESKNNDGTSLAGGVDPGRLEKMKERAAEKKFSFLYLHNPTQAIGLTYGARLLCMFSGWISSGSSPMSARLTTT